MVVVVCGGGRFIKSNAAAMGRVRRYATAPLVLIKGMKFGFACAWLPDCNGGVRRHANSR
jgi:hypothetical protein